MDGNFRDFEFLMHYLQPWYKLQWFGYTFQPNGIFKVGREIFSKNDFFLGSRYIVKKLD